jgi:hypothetical protein
MRVIKKSTAVLCVLALMLTFFATSASALILEEGNFGYELNTYSKYSILVRYTGSDSNVQIPNLYSNYPVKRITKSAFSGKRSITSISLPSVVSILDDRAFMNCSGLTSVTVPSTVTSWGTGVFINCSSVKTASISAATDKIPAYSFSGCSALENVELNSATITTIGDYAFQDCASLTDLSFLNQVTSIGYSAFDGSGVTELTIPEGVSEIPEYAFSNCLNLTRADIPRNVTYINANAFYNCPNLTLGVYRDSYAHRYAENYNIPFVIIEEYQKGDVNLDGKVDVNDATLIQKYCAKMVTLTSQQLGLADINNTGIVDVRCATTIQRILAGLL